MLRRTIDDIYLLQFYEKKYKKSYYLDWNDKIIPKVYFNENIHRSAKEPITKNIGSKIHKILGERVPKLSKILKFSKGKLCISGICMIEIINGSIPKSIDLCLHSCTVEETYEILEYCINIFEGAHSYGTNTIIIYENQVYLHISLIIYENIGQICGKFKFGYNSKDGYFCTVLAAFILANKWYPIDIPINNEEVSIYNKQGIAIISCNETLNLQDINKYGIGYGTFFCHPSVMFLHKCATLPVDNVIDYLPLRHIPITFYKELAYVPIDPKLYFGKNYIPSSIGINNNRYVAFYKVKINYNISKDIFNLLCDYWLEAEVTEAKNRLI